MTEEYSDSYYALETHTNRMRLLNRKLDDVDLDLANINMEVMVDHNILLSEMVEAASDIINDYSKILEELRQVHYVQATALKIYAKYYGSVLRVPEGFEEFGTKFNLSASVMPYPGETVVSINIKEDENERKYYRGRTKYQKIRDWFIQFRQSFRKSKR